MNKVLQMTRFSPSANSKIIRGGNLPPKLHLLTHGSLGPPHPTRQTPSRLSHPSPQGSRSIISILCYGTASSPPQNCPFPWEHPDPPSETWLLWPIAPDMPNGILISPAVFAGYLIVTSQTHRQRHRPTMEMSVAIGRIYMLRIYDAAWRGSVVRASVFGRRLSPSCVRLAADG